MRYTHRSRNRAVSQWMDYRSLKGRPRVQILCALIAALLNAPTRSRDGVRGNSYGNTPPNGVLRHSSPA